MGSLRLLLVASLLAVPASGLAQAPGKIGIELNKTEQQGELCQAYLMMENGTESRFESLELDLVLIDKDGIIARRLAVETAPLRPGRTTVKAFGIDRPACAGIGRILLNDVLACADETGPREDCFELLEASARGPVGFGQ